MTQEEKNVDILEPQEVQIDDSADSSLQAKKKKPNKVNLSILPPCDVYSSSTPVIKEHMQR